MLQQICEYIHNYFGREAYQGTFEIADGMISLPAVKDGQRILITGSDLNDGLYTYHPDGIKDDDDSSAAGLRDETFQGIVCALAVPPSVIALSGEVKAWVEKYGDVVNSPYQSENVIGVYSYTKGSSRAGAGEAQSVTWRDVFGEQLNRWRKVAF
jgi:hypothetical protein